MIDEETIEDMQDRIRKLEGDTVALLALCDRLTNELTRFVFKVEERFHSQNANMHSEIRRQSHF